MKKTLVFRASRPLAERTLVWDISHKYQRDMAYTDLFRILDAELDAYKDADSVTCALIGLARNGNPEACEALLCYRRNKDGEKFEEVEIRSGVSDPVLIARSERKSVLVKSPWFGETAADCLPGCPIEPEKFDPASPGKVCDDCQTVQYDLVTKGDHHGGNKTVCADRKSCHQRSPG